MKDGALYRPGHARSGEPTPQSQPSLFTDREIKAEIAYLVRVDKRYGWNALRAIAREKLFAVLSARQRGESPSDPCGWDSSCKNPSVQVINIRNSFNGPTPMCQFHIDTELAPE